MSFCFGPILSKKLSKSLSRSRQSRARSSNGEVDRFDSEELDTFDEDDKSKRLHEEVLEKLTATLSPIFPKLDEAFVNLGFLKQDSRSVQAQGQGQAHLVKRVSSLSLSMTGPQPRPTVSTMNNIGEVAESSAWSMSRKYLESVIQTESAKDSHLLEPDFMSEEARLKDRLKMLRLDMYVMQGDGNCQFRSVSFVLYGTQGHHQHVRRKAVEYMRQCPKDFEVFLGEDFHTYMSAMSQSGTWGDELTLRAISEVFNLTINIITSTQQNWFLRYTPSTGRPTREVFLTYIAPIHYNAIRRRTALNAVQGSFKRGSEVQKAYHQATHVVAR